MQAIVYQSASAAPNKVLSKLIETVWLRSNKILIYCEDQKRLAEFDNILWTYEQLSFLPHVLEDDELASKTPIVLASKQNNLNNANILVCLEPKLPEFAFDFEKVIYMYDGLAEHEKEKANSFIEQLKLSSIEVIEYQQDKSGAWQKIA